MAEISEEKMLELERQRAKLLEILEEKGIECEEDEQMAELIMKVNLMMNSNAFRTFTEGTLEEIIDTDSSTVKDYFCPNNTFLKKVTYLSAKIIKNNAFYGCSSLEDVYCPECTTLGGSAFSGCVNLINLILPKCTAYLGASGEMYGTSRIKTIDFSGVLGENIYYNVFEKLILRKNTVSELGIASYLNGGNPEGLTIYVPQDLLNSYKSATNWSVFADCFEALEGSPYESETWFGDE